jgi:hypothetical protein
VEKSILVKIFRKLSKKDIRELRKLVRSDYFNQRTDVIRLFDYLSAAMRQSDCDLSKPEVYKHVFPDQAYDDSLMRYAMSFLLKAVKRYFALIELEEYSIPWQVHLCRALRKRGMDELFEKEWAILEEKQRKQPFRNIQFHYDNYQLQLERYEYIHKQRRSGRMNLQELSDELTIFYIADTLRHSCTILSHQSMSQQDYNLQLVEEVIAHVEQGNFLDIPAVAMYYYAFKALQNLANETDFEQLKQLINENWSLFPSNEMRDIYLLAINFCIRKLNKGQRNYIREAFELYKSGFEREVLLEDGQLSRFTYKNVLMLAMGLEEWAWASHFLEAYKQYLPERERENIYTYNLAIYHFRKPDYDKAMRLLHKVELKDVLYALDARRMLLRMYYELQEYDALESLLDSFATYIRRQKDIGYHRENYLNLISFMKRILRSNLYDKAVKASIRAEAQQTEALAERNWLLTQLS